MTQQLNGRKKKLLELIVNEYVSTAEPVGSRTISRRYPMGVSSATLRNEMADLEELGYLEQPHTSAGRRPTQKGYRYYVDKLLKTSSITEEEEKVIQNSLAKMNEVEHIISVASRVLSQITSYTSLILGPQFKKSAFNQLRILPLDDNKGLVVMITNMGFVKNKVIELPRSLSGAELQQVVQYLNKKMYGLTIDQVTESLIKELKRDLFNRIELLEQAFLLLEESLNEEERARVFLGGTTNILNQPEFKDVNKIKQFLSLFEQEDLLFNLLEGEGDVCESSGDVVVKIGRENPLEEVHECALVTASYMIGNRTIGKVGVLGPTRMDYDRVLAVVRAITIHLNRVLER